MNFFKNALALILAILFIFSAMSVAVFADAGEIGTESNPENANDRYFAAAKSYLINTDLAEGDSDGYWYTFTATSAGILAIDASAADATGAKTEDFQVTVTCKGITYKANDVVFTRPVTPFRVSKNDVVTIHMTANPDANGNYPKLKIYCNITTSYGNANDPLLIKSKDGFIANVQANKSIIYQDGTNGGLWGGKGIIISAADASLIAKTEVVMNEETYKDKDNDGTIELMLPGDPDAQIAAHPIFEIFNLNGNDVSYVIRVVESAEESDVVAHQHNYEFLETLKAPTLLEEGIDLYICSGCGDVTEVSVPSVERWEKGDLNNDGDVNAIDSNLMKRVLVGLLMGDQVIDAADLYEDGTVNAQDASMLKRIISGIN